MNREEKAAAVEEMAQRLGEAEAVFAIDYRGLSVDQAAELRSRLAEANAVFRVVKNRLVIRAAHQAETESLVELLTGPTALTLIKGDPVAAAKAISTFRRERGVLEFKGGLMEGAPLEPEKFQAIARLPGIEQLRGQLVGVAASPLSGLVRGLGQLIQGLAVQLGQISEQGLVGVEAPAEAFEAPAAAEAEAAEAEEAEAEETLSEDDSEPETEAEETADQQGAPAEEAPEDDSTKEED